MTDIILTRRALFDIDGIEVDSTDKWGKGVADTYMNDVDAALKLISEYPNFLKRFGETDALLWYPVREHMLFCSMVADTIYVLTVKYGGMDLEEIMMDMEPLLLDEAKVMQSKLVNSKK